MFDLNKVAVDPDLEISGAWVDIAKDAKIKIARMNNKAYKDEIEKLRAPYKQRLRVGSLDEELGDEILNKAISRTILLGWKGLQIDGKDIEYSQNKCLELMSDPRFSEFREMVVTMSGNIENFRIAEVIDTGKNSAPTSSGQ